MSFPAPIAEADLDLDFQDVTQEAFRMVINLIGCLHEGLDGGKFLNDPKFVEILTWGNDLYTGPLGEDIAFDRYLLSKQDLLRMLEYTPILIRSLHVHVTSQVAWRLVVDPMAEKVAIQVRHAMLIGEEEIYLEERAAGLKVRHPYLNDSIPCSHLDKHPRGTENQGKVFVVYVALAIRSLSRYVKDVKRGEEGCEDFWIQPTSLNPVVMEYAGDLIEWWRVYGSKL